MDIDLLILYLDNYKSDGFQLGHVRVNIILNYYS